MTKWMAVYEVDPAGPRISSIRVRPASIELVDEWVVSWPVGIVGIPSPGWTARVEVFQDLGTSGELTTRQTRRMQPGHAIRMAMEQLYDLKGAPAWTELLGEEWRAVIERATTGDRLSRMSALAGTAARYVAAIDAGNRTPVASVAEQLGLKQPQVRDRLYKARQLGLLEPREAGRGRARGSLTDAAIKLLREEDSE